MATRSFTRSRRASAVVNLGEAVAPLITTRRWPAGRATAARNLRCRSARSKTTPFFDGMTRGRPSSTTIRALTGRPGTVLETGFSAFTSASMSSIGFRRAPSAAIVIAGVYTRGATLTSCRPSTSRIGPLVAGRAKEAIAWATAPSSITGRSGVTGSRAGSRPR